jgi:hypothetical protein
MTPINKDYDVVDNTIIMHMEKLNKERQDRTYLARQFSRYYYSLFRVTEEKIHHMHYTSIESLLGERHLFGLYSVFVVCEFKRLGRDISNKINFLSNIVDKLENDVIEDKISVNEADKLMKDYISELIKPNDDFSEIVNSIFYEKLGYTFDYETEKYKEKTND